MRRWWVLIVIMLSLLVVQATTLAVSRVHPVMYTVYLPLLQTTDVEVSSWSVEQQEPSLWRVMATMLRQMTCHKATWGPGEPEVDGESEPALSSDTAPRSLVAQARQPSLLYFTCSGVPDRYDSSANCRAIS